MPISSIERIGIPNLRRVSDTVFSGATLEGRLDYLTKIKESGITSVVDFRAGAASALKNQCDSLGLSYLQFPLDHTLSIGAKSKGNVSRVVGSDFVKKMKDFFTVMNKGNAYIGCQYGIDRTNAGLCYNYFLNAANKKQVAPIILTWADSPNLKATINRLVRSIYKTAKNLTAEQKGILGINVAKQDIFKDLFKTKIGEMIYRNLRYIR